MNTNTLEKMRKMHLWGMSRAFKTNLDAGRSESYTADEMVAHLIEAEYEERHTRSINRLVLNARFRYKAALEDVFYNTDRSIDRNQIMRLGSCDFINKNENILITGSTGIGKSYLASAFGHQACLQGYKVLYYNASKLFSHLKMAKGDGSYSKEIARIEKYQLLILDDFGIQPLDAQNRAALMEIIEDRQAKSSLIVTSQVPITQWYDVIGETTIADAIMDRIIHAATRIELTGESLRKHRQNN